MDGYRINSKNATIAYSLKSKRKRTRVKRKTFLFKKDFRKAKSILKAGFILSQFLLTSIYNIFVFFVSGHFFTVTVLKIPL